MRTLEQITHTISDNSMEARFITPVTDVSGAVIRFEHDSRNYAQAQKADFIAAVGAAAAAKYITMAGW